MAASISLLLAAGLLLVLSSFVNQVSSTNDFYECLPGIPSKGGKQIFTYSRGPQGAVINFELPDFLGECRA